MKGEQKPVASASHSKNQRFQTLSTIPFIIIIISFFSFCCVLLMSLWRVSFFLAFLSINLSIYKHPSLFSIRNPHFLHSETLTFFHAYFLSINIHFLNKKSSFYTPLLTLLILILIFIKRPFI